MKPVAYAIFAENGNIRMWSPTNEAVDALAAKEGLTVTPLYAAPGTVYLVCAQWDFEGNEDLAAFRDRASAEAFVAACEEHQDREPEDDEDGTKWENNHPGKPYLSPGSTLRGADSFIITEVTVL